MESPEVEDRFLAWLKARGTTLHPSVAIHDFSAEGQGRGAIALEDIAEDTILFSLRRPPLAGSPLLTVGTSLLPAKLPEDEWAKLKGSWTGLILCMMWEEARSKDPAVALEGSWGPYFDIMWVRPTSLRHQIADFVRRRPTEFDSLMFWSETELAELQGSTVAGKRLASLPNTSTPDQVTQARSAVNRLNEITSISSSRSSRCDGTLLSKPLSLSSDDAVSSRAVPGSSESWRRRDAAAMVHAGALPPHGLSDPLTLFPRRS